MKTIKYVLAAALLIGGTAQMSAQDKNPQYEAISKVIIDNKSNPKAAESQVKDFFKENKKNPEAVAAIGRAYLDIKDFENAKKYADLAIKANKKAGAGYILLGDIEANKENAGEAANWYQTAMTLDPQNPMGYVKYARIYQKVDPAGAVEALEKLRTIRPDYPVDAEAAHFYYRAGKLGKALEYYDKCDKSKLDRSQLAEYATIAYANQENKKSLDIALYGKKREPGHAAFNRLAFYNNLVLKNYDEALKYADLLFNHSDSLKAIYSDYENYGHAYVGKKDYKNAIKQFEKAYQMDNNKRDVLKLLSDAHMNDKNHAKAIDYYNQYMAKGDKKTVSDYETLANIYIDLSEIETDPAAKKRDLLNADEQYVELAKVFPKNKDYATYKRAGIHHTINPDVKQGEAKPFYEEYANSVGAKAEKSKGEIATLGVAYNYLAVYYIQNDNVATAKEYAQKLLEIQPENETAKQILAL